MESWTNMDTPPDLDEWRVLEPFRDVTISLARLDQLVGEFDSGCMDGRLSFLQFCQRAVVGEDAFANEREKVRRAEREAYRLRVEQEQRAQEERERQYALVRVAELWHDFDTGYKPQEPDGWCGDVICGRPACIRWYFYQTWLAEKEKEAVGG